MGDARYNNVGKTGASMVSGLQEEQSRDIEVGIGGWGNFKP